MISIAIPDTANVLNDALDTFFTNSNSGTCPTGPSSFTLMEEDGETPLNVSSVTKNVNDNKIEVDADTFDGVAIHGKVRAITEFNEPAFKSFVIYKADGCAT